MILSVPRQHILPLVACHLVLSGSRRCWAMPEQLKWYDESANNTP